jgi:hypothetical protein
MKRAGILLVVVLAALVLGCSSDRNSAKSPGSQPQSYLAGSEATIQPVQKHPQRIIVTSDEPSLPEGCHPRQVAQLVISFFDAFNHGDQALLSRIFFISEGPSPSDFSQSGYYPWSWYSVSEIGTEGRIRGGFVTYDQRKLLRYFARRHKHHERLHLLRISVTRTGLLDEENNLGIVYILTRNADDLDPGLGGPDNVASGKGAINCERRQIFVWSMDMKVGETRSARDAAGWLCVGPPGWRPGRAVVACA